MPKIFPFKGVRYNPDKVKFSNVITPPYDVISTENQNELYERSDYNLIRLEYGYQHPDDTENDNRYTRAAQTFQDWLNKEVLIQENKPVYYWYQQEFNWKGKTFTREGIIATLQVEPYEDGNVLPHEETLSKPKEDRMQLLEHCKANFSPVFGLYPDRESTVEKECAPFKESDPIINFTDADNQTHRVWIIDDPQTHQKLEELFASWFVFLADGHHRYETALEFSRKRGYDRVLIFLFNFYSPGLLILPTHRAIKGLKEFEPDSFLNNIQEHFSVKKFGPASNSGSVLSDFMNRLQEKNREQLSIGLCTKDNLYELDLKTPDDENKHDVDILQKYVLEETLGITTEEVRKGEFLTYTRSEEEALNLVLDGEAQASFILTPSSKEQIMKTAQQGEKLPQKSTFFYPKLVSGLILNKLD